MVVVVAGRAIEMRDGMEFNLFSAASRVLSNMRTYAHRRRVQQRLESLDDRMLADIGILRSDIKAHVWGL